MSELLAAETVSGNKPSGFSRTAISAHDTASVNRSAKRLAIAMALYMLKL